MTSTLSQTRRGAAEGAEESAPPAAPTSSLIARDRYSPAAGVALVTLLHGP